MSLLRALAILAASSIALPLALNCSGCSEDNGPNGEPCEPISNAGEDQTGTVGTDVVLSGAQVVGTVIDAGQNIGVTASAGVSELTAVAGSSINVGAVDNVVGGVLEAGDSVTVNSSAGSIDGAEILSDGSTMVSAAVDIRDLDLLGSSTAALAAGAGCGILIVCTLSCARPPETPSPGPIPGCFGRNHGSAASKYVCVGVRD